MDEFLSNMQKINNLFDIIASSYDRLEAATEKEHFRYFLNQNKTSKDYFLSLSEEIDFFIDEIHSINIFKERLAKLIKQTKYKIEIICCAIIFFCDLYYKDKITNRPSSLEASLKIGPLNTNQNTVLVYTKTHDSLLSYAGRKIKFRNKINYDPTTINGEMNNFILIRKKDTKIIPQLIRLQDDYIKDIIKQNKNIKIGVAPFASEILLQIQTDYPSFQICGALEGKEPEIYKRYKRTIDKMIVDGCNIAVFPELSLTRNVYDWVKNDLLKLSDSSLRLIICGSIWENNTNYLNILSSNGDEIIKVMKYSPYKHTDPSGIVFEEDLKNDEEKIEIIEIAGFGRIYTCICFDFLNKRRLSYSSMLECNTSIIASYSTSESQFRTNLELSNMAIFCNYCAPRFKYKKSEEKEINIGFLSLPSKKDSDMYNHILSYNACEECFTNCNDKSCYVKYTIFPEEIIEVEPNIKTIKCAQEKVWINLI